MNKGRRGTVLFSFGSLLRIEQVPIEIQAEILSVFRQLEDYQFLWKHEKPEMLAELMTNTTNVELVQWLPQNDLLSELFFCCLTYDLSILDDRRVKLFITHCGMNSYMESMRAAVPLIAIPVKCWFALTS